jgi:diacylglycerol kinase family enzyme
MPGIGVVSNANARVNKISPVLKNTLNFMLGRRGEVISTYSTDDVDSTVKDFINYDIDIIAISGGDGTAHVTLEKLLKTYKGDELPPILLLPSGTQNMVPKSFGITRNSYATMLSTLTKYVHNIPIRVIKRNLLKVNDHYSFMFGLGAPTRILEVNYERGKAPLKSVALLFKYFYDAFKGVGLAKELIRPMNVTYQYENETPVNKQLNTIFSSFTEELALRFKMFPRAGWYENQFENLFMDVNIKEGIIAIPQMWNGTLRKFPGIDRRLAKSLKISIEEPETYTLDGEIYGPESEFNISSGPELKFVVPWLSRFDKMVLKRSEKIGPWGQSFYF